MCGIAGKLNFKNQKVSVEEIQHMTNVISHRGPDDEGVFIDGNIGLGHRRLSIIDLSPAGHQPMSDNTERIWITFNGEIYNFEELRQELVSDGVKLKSHTDTEVIIYLYKRYGVECLKKLRGMFAFAIWDADTKELFIAKDRLGKKPVKYFYNEQTFIFASELKALFTNTEIQKEVDSEAISDYLTFGYVPHPKTGFKHIYKLEPAHYLIVQPDGSVTKKQYWDLDFSQKLNLNKVEWEEKILETLKESVRLRMIADVPLGAHLSGGIDSSLVVALMAEQSSQKIKTYSVGFAEEQYNELPYAKLVAQQYGTDHHEIIVEPKNVEDILPKLAYHYEEPFADNSALPTWYLCKETRKDITVALNGDGGDETFGGYYRYQAMALHRLLNSIPGAIYGSHIISRLLSPISRTGRLLRTIKLSAPDAYFNIISIFSRQEKYVLLRSDLNSSCDKNYIKNDFEFMDQFLYLGIKTHLADGLIPKVDIASMAHALEVRSPLLDHELMELSAQMPSSLKLNYRNKKILLKNIAHSYIPAQCIDRPKKGFDAPLEYWFKGTLGETVREYLDESVLPDLGIKKDAVRSILGEHLNKKKNNAKKIWTLLMLFVWHRDYFAK